MSVPAGDPGRIATEAAADSDRVLIAEVRRGNAAGAAGLFERWARPILRFSARMLGNPAEAEDVAQEVFLKMIDRVEQYDGRAPVSAWLFTIAANACRDRLRRGGRLVPMNGIADVPAPGGGALTRLIEEERGARVRRALEALTVEQREALVLARFEGMRYEEIAQVLGTTESAVKTRVFRAMQVLKDHFADDVRGPKAKGPDGGRR